MIKLSVPITLPFGASGSFSELKKTKFKILINKFRELTKHNHVFLEYTLSISIGHNPILKFNEIDSAGLKIPFQIVHHYLSRFEEEKTHFTVDILIDTDIRSISQDYSCPDDILNDIIFSLVIFIHGNLNIVGFARFSPVIVVDDMKIIFNGRLAYLLNPWQDWFCSLSTLKIILNANLKDQINSNAKHYKTILPHVEYNIKPLDIDQLISSSKYPSHTIDNIFIFSRILSEIIRMHPSYDYSAIIGLLTALVEGLFKINGENRYKFKIKIANLMNDNSLGKTLNEIYDSRSAFFHTGKFNKLNDIFEEITIEFLLVVIKKAINYSSTREINSETLDFI